MRVHPFGLRTRLLLLVVFALLPALLLISWTARDQRRSARAEAQADALQLARLLSAEQSGTIERARQLLSAVGQFPVVRSANTAACNARLAGLLAGTPGYANIGVVGTDGYAVCGAVPPGQAMYLGDRDWFRATVASRDFAVGSFVIGRVTGRPILTTAMPVLDDAGEIEVIVTASLDLEWLNQRTASVRLPAGATMTVIDRNGTILVRQPDPAAWIGRQAPDTDISREIGERQEGMAEARGVDGVPRLYGFVPFGRTEDGVSVAIGIPTSVAYRDVDRAYRRSLMALGLIGVLALGAAWFGGNLFILRPIGGLVRVTARLRGGDLSARATESAGAAELADLARGIDDMAAALQLREEDRRRSAELYQTLVRNIPNSAVALFDHDLRYLLADGRGLADIGLTPAEMVGRTVRDVLPSEALESVEPLFRAALEGEEGAVEVVYGARTRRVHAVPVRDGQGKVMAGMAITQDVTERKQTEEALGEALWRLAVQHGEGERARSRMRAVLDATGEGIALVAADGRFLIVNRRFAELFEIRSDEVLGQPAHELRGLLGQAFADPTAFDALILTPLTDKGRRSTEIAGQVAPRQRELEFFTTPVQSDEEEYLGRLYVVRDITHERAVDRMKSEFVSLVSHELRTPLTSIKGYIDLILDGEAGAVPADQGEFLGIARANADHLVSLINDLLDVSRIEGGAIELNLALVDVARLIGATAGALRPQIGTKGQHLTLDLPEDLPAVVADWGRLTQILTNLLSNAHKYTPAGGSIGVTARVAQDQLRIDVRDTGVGLSVEEQGKLFTRFFRAKNRTTQEVGGTGLGLAITRSLVEMHGGRITVTSAPGEGSTFSVLLPRGDAPARDLVA